MLAGLFFPLDNTIVFLSLNAEIEKTHLKISVYSDLITRLRVICITVKSVIFDNRLIFAVKRLGKRNAFAVVIKRTHTDGVY